MGPKRREILFGIPEVTGNDINKFTTRGGKNLLKYQFRRCGQTARNWAGQQKRQSGAEGKRNRTGKNVAKITK